MWPATGLNLTLLCIRVTCDGVSLHRVSKRYFAKCKMYRYSVPNHAPQHEGDSDAETASDSGRCSLKKKNPSTPNEHVAGWAPGPLWTLLKKNVCLPESL